MDFSLSRRSSSIYSKVSSSLRKRQSRQSSISHSPTLSISPPTVFASTPRSSRSSTAIVPLSTEELKHNAVAALTSLYTNQNATGNDLISPNIIIEHDEFDDSPIDLSSFSSSLSAMPALDLDVLEVAADQHQRKVWLRSSIGGLSDGRMKQSVDVVTFGDEGLLVSLLGEWRSPGREDVRQEGSESDVEE